LLAQFDSPIDRSIPHIFWQFSHHGIELILRFTLPKSRSLTLNKTPTQHGILSSEVHRFFISATASKGIEFHGLYLQFLSLQYYFYTLVHIWHLQKSAVSFNSSSQCHFHQLPLQPHYSHRQC
jgi:hypothetical protein